MTDDIGLVQRKLEDFCKGVNELHKQSLIMADMVLGLLAERDAALAGRHGVHSKRDLSIEQRGEAVIKELRSMAGEDDVGGVAVDVIASAIGLIQLAMGLDAYGE